MPEANIVTLINAQADRSSLLEAFRDLTGAAWQQPALFYFAGNGSRTADGQPAILPYDAAQGTAANDIALSELAGEVQRIARDVPTNLMVVIDAGWAEGLQLPWVLRGAAGMRLFTTVSDPVGQSGPGFGGEAWSWGGAWRPDDPRSMASAAGWRSVWPLSASGGRRSIPRRCRQRSCTSCEPSRSDCRGGVPSLFGEPKKVIHGVLAYTLIKSLREIRCEDLTFRGATGFFRARVEVVAAILHRRQTG